MSRESFSNIHLGGIGDSILTGIPNSIPRIVGMNLHDTPALITANQKMTAEAGAGVPNEFCLQRINASNGIRYWFSYTSGKIWQDKAGTWTLVYTVTPTAGDAWCLGAAEYNGYLIWATSARLHRIAVASADGAAAWTANVVANWQTLANANANWHPMKEVNLVLYIGDGNQVHQVNNVTFSANALDIYTPHQISALGKTRTSLLIGTTLANSVNRCSVFSWNTFSGSFSYEDEYEEAGINAFIEGDNFILVNAGVSGVIYVLGDQSSEVYKRIRGSYSPTAKCKVNPEAKGIYKGYPIFGVSNVTGNPCDQGIWSIARYGANYNLVLNLEFPISAVDGDGYPVVSGVEIGAILISGENVWISWRYNSTSGIDKLDYSNKIAKPFMEFRALKGDRDSQITFKKMSVPYQSLSTNTSIVLKTKVNHATIFSAYDASTGVAVDDTQRKVAFIETKQDASILQPRLEFATSGNNSPVIEGLIIDY